MGQNLLHINTVVVLSEFAFSIAFVLLFGCMGHGVCLISGFCRGVEEDAIRDNWITP